MGFKTITIKEDVYKKIARAKRKNESFSELFDRKFSEETIEERTNRILKYAGIWKMTEKEYKEKLEEIKKGRENSEKNFQERMKYLEQYRK